MLTSVVQALLVVTELLVLTHQGPTHAAVHLEHMVTLTHNAVSTYIYKYVYQTTKIILYKAAAYYLLPYYPFHS